MTDREGIKINVQHSFALDQLHLTLPPTSKIADAISMVSQRIGLHQELIELWSTEREVPTKAISELGGLIVVSLVCLLCSLSFCIFLLIGHSTRYNRRS